MSVHADPPRHHIEIIGIPMDLGQHQRGLDMGPSAIRYAGLATRLRQLGHEVADTGDVQVPSAVIIPEADRIPTISRICTEVYARVQRTVADGHLPIALGGDHSVAIGTAAGASHFAPRGLIWIDAHGDFNTPDTSPSGNLHGMPLAVLRGSGDSRLLSIGREGAKFAAADVAILGLRQLDYRERALLKESGMSLFTMRDIDERGVGSVISEVLSRLSHLKKLHLSLDMDALDPSEAPGVGTPVRGGLSFREAHLIMESIADSGRLGSMDLVEVNPALDVRNRTAELAVDLAVSAFGQSIL